MAVYFGVQNDWGVYFGVQIDWGVYFWCAD